MARARSCPVCGGDAAPRPGNRTFPFCGERCRLVDLGKWLGEAYRIPAGLAGDGAVPAPPEPDPDPDR